MACTPGSRMSDGRIFTDYRPRIDQHLYDHQSRPAEGTYEQRQEMIHSADDIIRRYRDSAFGAASRGPCVEPFNIGTMVPETDRFVCDKVSCARVPVAAGNGMGLGTGRDYGALTPEQQVAQETFLTRAQASSRSCVGVQPRAVDAPVHTL